MRIIERFCVFGYFCLANEQDRDASILSKLDNFRVKYITYEELRQSL